MKRFIVSFFILNLFLILFQTNTYADSIRTAYNNDIEYPGYKERIDVIKKNHPNWNFIIMKTTLDWNDVIANEYTGHHDSPKNLIQGKSKGWICSICGEEVYDTGDWMCASEQAIKYYMDPRNFLVDSPYLFQFLQIDYSETRDEDVYKALSGTFLYSMENAVLINNICRESNANPYFIIARIIQEQGTAGGDTYRMIDTDGKVYYNLFNIGAGGNGDEVYNNALKKAKNEGWISVESCIRGGISFLISSYIGYKQNTIYLQKFDVENYNGLYWKQYMQNIEAPKTESISMYNKMKNANLLNSNLTFIIPVYENMPTTACILPDSIGELYPKNIRVKEGHSRIVIRAGRSTSTSVVSYINDSSTIVLSVERYDDGWHKIILADGTQGYVKWNSNYLEEIDDIVNCNENVKLNQSTSLRVGPEINQTEITYLEKGEELTRIENSGMYNIGGNVWDRVKLKDGREGFIQRDYLAIISENTNTQNVVQNILIMNTSNEENTIVYNERNQTIEEINSNETNQSTISQENIIEENTVAKNSIAEENNIENETIIDENTNSLNEELYNNEFENDITNQDQNPIFVRKGDVNGDGFVKANDYLIIKDFIMDNNNIDVTDKFLMAADVTGDGKVKANDYLKIKDHIMTGIEL